MKKTKKMRIPFNKGLDLESIPGYQNPSSLAEAKNVVVKNKGGVKKAPGIRSIDYSASTEQRTGIQAAIQFIGISGSASFSEVVQVRQGRIEVLRNGNLIDLGLAVSPSDTVTFERFANKLIIHFENTAPQQYAPGGTTVEDAGIISAHKT